jgi:acylphosphatase
MISYQIYYEGRVQGVGFRATVLQLARGFDLTGEVKNLPDGRVSLLLQGEPQELEAFLKEIRESVLSSHIVAEEKSELPMTFAPPLRGFKIVK